VHTHRVSIGAAIRIVALALLLASAQAVDARTRQDCEQAYTPRNGQRGKDVLWVPTNDIMVERMLAMAKVTGNDLLYDLGAGDGKIAITAAKRYGAAAVGIEYNPDLVQLAKCLVEVEGVGHLVSIQQGDLFEMDFSDATVVMLYLSPNLNVRLRPTLLAMKPGTRVVSNSFMMGHWQPDDRVLSREGRAYLWVVPAQVAGTWQFVSKTGEHRFSVHLNQMFQQLSGTAGERGAKLKATRLHGAHIEFAFDTPDERIQLTGRVNGDRIEATVRRGGKSAAYIGTRVSATATLPFAGDRTPPRR